MPVKTRYHHGDLKNALIEAGATVLAREGPSALSLRRVAQEAGVSHAAPYAHFADKPALIAAIATEGYRRLYEVLLETIEAQKGRPARQLHAAAAAYVTFALEHPNLFKVTMSQVVEKHRQYRAFVEISNRCFALLLRLVRTNQVAGILEKAPPALAAVSLWSSIHGLATLLLEDQLSSRVKARFPVAKMVRFTLRQATRGEHPRRCNRPCST